MFAIDSGRSRGSRDVSRFAGEGVGEVAAFKVGEDQRFGIREGQVAANGCSGIVGCARSNREPQVGKRGDASEVAKVRIVQTWSSGTYRDVGPKLIEMIPTAQGLRISSEVMLSSTLVNAPKELADSSHHFAFVWNDKVVIQTEAGDLAIGRPRLISGLIGGDIEVEGGEVELEIETFVVKQAAKLT